MDLRTLLLLANLATATIAAAPAEPRIKRSAAIQVGAVESFNRDNCGGLSFGILGYDINVAPPFEDGGCATAALSQDGNFAWSVYVSDLSRGCAATFYTDDNCSQDVTPAQRAGECLNAPPGDQPWRSFSIDGCD